MAAAVVKLGIKQRWLVSLTPRPFTPVVRVPRPIQEADWYPESVWMFWGSEKSL